MADEQHISQGKSKRKKNVSQDIGKLRSSDRSMQFSNRDSCNTSELSTKYDNLSQMTGVTGMTGMTKLDQDGIIDIGIEERKRVPDHLKSSASNPLNKAFINYDESESETDSDYSESDRSSQRSGASRPGSDYKANLEYLFEQGVMVKELPKETE